jgi:hypothetical protein
MGLASCWASGGVVATASSYRHVPCRSKTRDLQACLHSAALCSAKDGCCIGLHGRSIVLLTRWRCSDLVMQRGAHLCHLRLAAAPEVLLHHIKEDLILPMLHSGIANLREHSNGWRCSSIDSHERCDTSTGAMVSAPCRRQFCFARVAADLRLPLGSLLKRDMMPTVCMCQASLGRKRCWCHGGRAASQTRVGCPVCSTFVWSGLQCSTHVRERLDSAVEQGQQSASSTMDGLCGVSTA